MKQLNGLIGYEESQEVTKAFRGKGLNFFSCDMQDCSGGHPEWHKKDDIHRLMHHHKEWPYKWDFVGLHPVCKKLANSGIRWLTSRKPKDGYHWSEKHGVYINPNRWSEMVKAAEEFKLCLEYVKNCGKGYVENPIMHPYAAEIIGMKLTQIIQPWMFGHTTQKATCLWIFGLPNLVPTEVIPKQDRTQEIWLCPPGPDREKIRSKTFPGIAKAMADQWGPFLFNNGTIWK